MLHGMTYVPCSRSYVMRSLASAVVTVLQATHAMWMDTVMRMYFMRLDMHLEGVMVSNKLLASM
jgi:hypothetical protein